MRFPADVPVLVDGDITLRAHRLDDVDAIVEQCNDPVSVQWTTVPVGYTREMGIDWVTRIIPRAWESEEEQIFAIETTHPDGQRRYGGSLSLRAEGDRRGELAFGAHPAVRSRGMMTRAVALLLDYGFGERDIETVVWLANVGNTASRRVAWKSGFTFAGVMRRWLQQRGDHLDGWVATLHKADPRVPTTRWVDSPVIRGERLTLRPLEDKDVEQIVQTGSDARSRQWLAALPDPYTALQAKEFVARCRAAPSSGDKVFWTVADSATDTLVAHIALPTLGRVNAEIGYWTHPDARGRGVMREALAMVVRHGFISEADGGLGLHRLALRAAVGNTASCHVAVSNGFVECGREREAERVGDGGFADVAHFELLAPR